MKNVYLQTKGGKDDVTFILYSGKIQERHTAIYTALERLERAELLLVNSGLQDL